MKEGAPRAGVPFIGVPAVGASRLSPHVLAYLGDAVYELYVRSRMVAAGPPVPIRQLHRRTVALVRAEAQVEALRCLEPLLTDEERDVARRGRNAGAATYVSGSPEQRAGSTAFEALVGYLYWDGRWSRLEQLLDVVFQRLAAPPGEEARHGAPPDA